MSDTSTSSLTETESEISSAEYNLAAGDGGQIQAQRKEDDATAQKRSQRRAAESDVELSAGDHVEPKAKPSGSSIYGTPELEQRWKLRLQKLAEFENMQSERNESPAANGDESSAEPKTWKQFWHDAQLNSTTDSDP